MGAVGDNLEKLHLRCGLEAGQCVQIVLDRCEIRYHLSTFGELDTARDLSIVVKDRDGQALGEYRLSRETNILHEHTFRQILDAVQHLAHVTPRFSAAKVFTALLDALDEVNNTEAFEEPPGHDLEFILGADRFKEMEIRHSNGKEQLAIVYRILPNFKELALDLHSLDSRFEIHFATQAHEPSVVAVRVNQRRNTITLELPPAFCFENKGSPPISSCLPLEIRIPSAQSADSHIRSIAEVLSEGGLSALAAKFKVPMELLEYEDLSTLLTDPAEINFYNSLNEHDALIYLGYGAALANFSDTNHCGALISLTFGEKLLSLSISASPELGSASKSWIFAVPAGKAAEDLKNTQVLSDIYTALTSKGAYSEIRTIIEALNAMQVNESKVVGAHIRPVSRSPSSVDFVFGYDPLVTTGLLGGLEVVPFAPQPHSRQPRLDLEFSLAIVNGAQPLRMTFANDQEFSLHGSAIDDVMLFVTDGGVTFRCNNRMNSQFMGYIPSFANSPSSATLAAIAKQMSLQLLEDSWESHLTLQKLLENDCFVRAPSGGYLRMLGGTPHATDAIPPASPVPGYPHWYPAVLPQFESPLLQNQFGTRATLAERRISYDLAGKIARELREVFCNSEFFNSSKKLHLNVRTSNDGFNLVAETSRLVTEFRIRGGNIDRIQCKFEAGGIGKVSYILRAEQRGGPGFKEFDDMRKLLEALSAIDSQYLQHLVETTARFSLQVTDTYKLLTKFFGPHSVTLQTVGINPHQ